MGFNCAGRTHIGLRRKLNEDAIFLSDERCIWAVADGMGGHEAGEVASAMVIEGLSHLCATSQADDPGQAAVAAIEKVNADLVELADAQYQQRTIGSTVVGLVANKQRFTCFWVGDSRCYHLSSAGIAQITRDHSLVQDLVDAGMLKPEEAESHPNANVVTRAVGASDHIAIDIVEGAINAGDAFLLASDGLTRLVNAAEITEALHAPDADTAADRLIELSLERGAPDNVSLIVVRVV